MAEKGNQQKIISIINGQTAAIETFANDIMMETVGVLTASRMK